MEFERYGPRLFDADLRIFGKLLAGVSHCWGSNR
jgi:hypothetical protein